jgi:hypothetical protein
MEFEIHYSLNQGETDRDFSAEDPVVITNRVKHLAFYAILSMCYAICLSEICTNMSKLRSEYQRFLARSY